MCIKLKALGVCETLEKSVADMRAFIRKPSGEYDEALLCGPIGELVGPPEWARILLPELQNCFSILLHLTKEAKLILWVRQKPYISDK